MAQIILLLIYYISQVYLVDVSGLDGNIAILGMLAVGIAFIVGKLDSINETLKDNII